MCSLYKIFRTVLFVAAEFIHENCRVSYETISLTFIFVAFTNKWINVTNYSFYMD